MINGIMGLLSIIGSSVLTFPGPLQATANMNITAKQVIDNPSAQIGFLDQNNQFMTNPRIELPTMSSNLSCLSYGNGSTTTSIGMPDQQLFISVPPQYDAWSLSVIGNSDWKSSSTDKVITLNDRYAGGCLPNPDTTNTNSLGGLMYVDPSSATLKNFCLHSCTNQNVELGGPSDFGANDDHRVPIVYSNISRNFWQGAIEKVTISQTMPANLPLGEYFVELAFELELL